MGFGRYVDYCLKLVAMMQACGVIPLIVFDGGKLPMKLAEEDGRDRWGQRFRINPRLPGQSGGVCARVACDWTSINLC